MADSLTPLLVTGGFTLAATITGSALTTYANSRQERRQDLKADYFRNLDQRRSFILEFLLVYDELRRLVEQGGAARADYASDERFVRHLDDLRRRLGEGRTNLELFCRPTTRSVVGEAEQLGRYGWMVLVGRQSASDEQLTTHAAAMREHKDALFKAFRAELGEVP